MGNEIIQILIWCVVGAIALYILVKIIRQVTLYSPMQPFVDTIPGMTIEEGYAVLANNDVKSIPSDKVLLEGGLFGVFNPDGWRIVKVKKGGWHFPWIGYLLFWFPIVWIFILLSYFDGYKYTFVCEKVR